MINSDSNLIPLYKFPGKAHATLTSLEKDDFVLAFMNEAQQEIFQMYGSDDISIDSAHGTNKYNIQLTSIIIRDNNCQFSCGLPLV